MKKTIKIVIAMLVLFTMILITKSNAAIETKSKGYTAKTQIDAYQLCYDMRNPTSSLGNNSLDPHLELNSDFAAWAYLGMSAYGSNLKNKQVLAGVNFYSSTLNMTGVLSTAGIPPSSVTAGILDIDGTSNLISKYGKTKYIETFDSNYMTANTKGQALMEINGWYQNPNNMKVVRRYGSSYQCVSGSETETGLFRPIIWN